MPQLIPQININDIKDVLSYSQDVQDPKIDDLIHDWSIHKNLMSKLFLKEKCIYCYPEEVCFDLSDEDKEDRYSSFKDWLDHVLDDFENPLMQFLDCITSEEFFNNCLKNDYILSSKDNKKIPKGSKILKAFKYFTEDQDFLHNIQNKASAIIQENKISGYLCFSIHPLDYLSSSENNYNWRSCHALDGEYRCGNLSYMADRSTMIVYLKGADDVKLPHFPENVKWNDKKWRMLLHFDKNCEVCFAGRQYPFTSISALKKIYEIFTEEMVPTEHLHGSPWFGIPPQEVKQEWKEWSNDYLSKIPYGNNKIADVEENRYGIINNAIFDKYHLITDARDSTHFNDLIKSTFYHAPYYMYRSFWSPRENLHIEVGHPVKCINCGENIALGYDNGMFCRSCSDEFMPNEDLVVCDCCGRTFNFSEEGSWVGNDRLCPSCVDTETFQCADCGDICYNDEQYWSEKCGGYVCEYCHNLEVNGAKEFECVEASPIISEITPTAFEPITITDSYALNLSNATATATINTEVSVEELRRALDQWHEAEIV